MSSADLELLLYRILSGKIWFTYHNDNYELIAPSYSIRYEAQLLYNNILNDEKYNEWLREENLEFILINLGLWNKDSAQLIKSMETKIDKAKIELYKAATSPEKVKNIRKNLYNYRNQLDKILSHKNEMYTNTLEGYASSIKNEYIICNTLFTNNKRVFNTTSNSNSASYIQFNNLVNEVNKQNLPLSCYKELARSGIWRSYWNCNKEHIFNGAVSDWTDDQRTLVSMTRMYDNVYEHPDCPSDAIIEDDDMLDGWMLYQKQEITKQKKQAQVDQAHSKLKNAQEVFLMANNSEEVEEIVGLNSEESLRKMKGRLNYIKQNGGEVPESQLPDVQMDLRNQMAQMSRNKR